MTLCDILSSVERPVQFPCWKSILHSLSFATNNLAVWPRPLKNIYKNYQISLPVKEKRGDMSRALQSSSWSVSYLFICSTNFFSLKITDGVACVSGGFLNLVCKRGWQFRASFSKVTNAYVPWLSLSTFKSTSSLTHLPFYPSNKSINQRVNEVVMCFRVKFWCLSGLLLQGCECSCSRSWIAKLRTSEPGWTGKKENEDTRTSGHQLTSRFVLPFKYLFH